MLTDFWPMFQFYGLEYSRKPLASLVFSGGIKLEHWPEMG